MFQNYAQPMMNKRRPSMWGQNDDEQMSATGKAQPDNMGDGWKRYASGTLGGFQSGGVGGAAIGALMSYLQRKKK